MIGINLYAPKSNYYQNSKLYFKGNFSSYEEELYHDKAQEIMRDYKTFPLTKTCGYPETYVDSNWFLERTLFPLLRTGDKKDENIVREVLNTLKIYPHCEDSYRGHNVPVFHYEPLNTKDCFESFKDFYGFDSSNCNTKKSIYSSYDKETMQKEDIQNKLDRIKQNKQIEDKRELARTQLRPFVKKLADFDCAKSAVLPNCIMLLGENQDTAFYIAQWLKDVCAKNDFKYLCGYSQTKENMQEELIELLDESEELYQNSGKRSIIFVPHLDDLINTKKNSAENIAEMKLIMQGADEDYHSTIVFWTKPKNLPELDEGALQLNRVGLKVNI